MRSFFDDDAVDERARMDAEREISALLERCDAEAAAMVAGRELDDDVLEAEVAKLLDA